MLSLLPGDAAAHTLLSLVGTDFTKPVCAHQRQEPSIDMYVYASCLHKITEYHCHHLS